MASKVDQIGDTASRRTPDYFYDPEIGNFYFGQGHPMKPHRVRMTHSLVVSYGLYRNMNVFQPKPGKPDMMSRFHSNDYVDFLGAITPNNLKEYKEQGLYEYCQRYTAGSICGAVRINHKQSDIVVNWAGGMHHAKKAEASGFCYCNDIVLSILELLKYHRRVLYIDIDIHHGDGVEEAFFTTNRVMCVSFHKYGNFFPGTGSESDVGEREGKGYSLNFPLKDGMDDASYRSVFQPVIQKVMEHYQPQAVVLCCGADSIAGDRLGCWNLSVKGHAECLQYVKSFGIPMLVLGGGGYTPKNVARCWAYETAALMGAQLPDQLPYHDFYDYYAPDYRLHMDEKPMVNDNDPSVLRSHSVALMEMLKGLQAVPGVQIQTGQPGTRQTPGDAMDVGQLGGEMLEGGEVEGEEGTDVTRDIKAEHKGEFYDRSQAEGQQLDPCQTVMDLEGKGMKRNQ